MFEKRTHSVLEQSNQFIVHVLVIVRDIQADDSLLVQVLFEPFLQSVAMGFFHHKDVLRPFDQFRCCWDRGIFVEPGRSNVKTLHTGEDDFCRGASEFILAA